MKYNQHDIQVIETFVLFVYNGNDIKWKVVSNVMSHFKGIRRVCYAVPWEPSWCLQLENYTYGSPHQHAPCR